MWAECSSHKLDFVQKCQSLRYYEENENNGETREILIFFHLQFRIPYASQHINYRPFIKQVWYCSIKLKYSLPIDIIISNSYSHHNNNVRRNEILLKYF